MDQNTLYKVIGISHETQTLVDEAKTNIMIEQDMDGDEQNHCLDI
jgi:hypothetical protein